MTHGDVTLAVGLSPTELAEGDLDVISPIDGELIGRVTIKTPQEVASMIASGVKAFDSWRDVPAPRRGEFIRLLGNELRERKEPLARLVSTE